MYVMSSMPPSQQSIAGGIFQTVAKLCTTLGLGVATAVFNAVERKPSLASYWDPVSQPYAATFWFSMACSLFSLFLVPFLTVGTQGGKVAKPDPSTGGGDTPDVAVAEHPEKEAEAEAMVDQALPTKG